MPALPGAAQPVELPDVARGPAARPRPSKASAACAEAEVIAAMTQPDTSPPPDDPVDDDDADGYPVKRVIWASDAAGMKAPATRAPRSVWDLAVITSAAGMLKGGGRFGHAAGFDAQPPAKDAPTGHVDREAGVTRCTGRQYPANRWDADRVDQLRQRQAQFKPPRPSRKAKTRGKKVRVWDGEQTE